jgi:predicted nucleic acid-binding protein
MTVFADTFALIAWLSPGDDAHARVKAYLDGFTGRLVTTEWVLMEVADALSAPSAPSALSTVVAFLKAVRADRLFEIIGYEASF